MMEWINSTLGTIFYSMVIFAAGAWMGRPMMNWLYCKMPWTKCDNCMKDN